MKENLRKFWIHLIYIKEIFFKFQAELSCFAF